MDKENLNGIPEEETQAAEIQAEETPAEEVTEETAQETADTNETEELPADDTQAEEAENAEDENTEAEEEENLCSVCGEKEASEGSEYCVECETKMLKRRIPFLGWISGFVALGFSLFAFLLAIVAVVPSGYVALGDSYASEKNWHAACEVYANVSEASTQFNEYANYIFQTDFQFVRSGEGVSKRLINVVANYYSPIDAYYYAQNSLSSKALGQKFMEGYAKAYNDNYEAYMQMAETFNKALEGETEIEAVLEELEAFKGTEGINDVYVDYYKFAIAYELGEDAEAQIELLRELEAAAEASGEDYGWIYNQALAQALYDTGKGEEAVEYLDKIIASNKSSYDAYLLKMKIQLQQGDTEAAGETVAEFKENSAYCELAYFANLLEIQYLRCTGKYDEAQALCVEAAAAHETVPETNGVINMLYSMEGKLLTTSEFNRQDALICMVKGDYAAAFSSMMEAYSMESYYAYYMQNSVALNDPNFYGALYLSAKLLSTSDMMTEENAADVEYVLSMFEEGTMSESIEAIINGEKTVEEVLTKGAFDLA